MIGVESSNAKAAFYVLETIEETDPYGDTVERDRWVPTEKKYPAHFEPQGSEYIQSETGERVRRSDRILVPLSAADNVTTGNPVEVHYLGASEVWRVSSLSRRSIDGHQGYVQAELADYDDESGPDLYETVW